MIEKAVFWIVSRFAEYWMRRTLKQYGYFVVNVFDKVIIRINRDGTVTTTITTK